MSDEFALDPELLQDFLTECGELLQQLDEDMVSLETSPEDEELLNRIFRAVHTIKGTSGFMGFTSVVELTHQAEDVLNLLRHRERKVTRHTMDVLLAVSDQLGVMMEDIREQRDASYDLSTLLAQLKEIEEGHDPSFPVSAPQPADAVPGPSSASASVSPVVQKAAEPTAAATAPATMPAQTAAAAEPADHAQGGGSRKAAAAANEGDRTIRVNVGKLDELINLVGELVLERNRVLQLSREVASLGIPESVRSALNQATARLSFITGELQTASLKTRMVPVETLFRRFPRMVRDISKALGKDVDLLITGEETEIDRNVVEGIADPLVHLIRNSLDHGIETPDLREANGKPATGRLHIDASQQGDHIVILVQDDGKGMDPERIAKKAIEKGLVTAERLRTMSEREILDLIFQPGFSTAEKVSDVSGRGVGMDVVRTNLKKLNGTVEVDSELGQGATVRLMLPLTLAILPVLLVQAEEDVYAVPLRTVVEIVRVDRESIHRMDGAEIMRLRDEVFPLRHLRELLGHPPADATADSLRVVIMAIGERKIGLVVDQWLGQEETVIKSLGSYLGHVNGMAGATISGDGRVRLILDPAVIAGSLRSPQR
jgi:two-component system chemotaxis sensor kinase CheA